MEFIPLEKHNNKSKGKQEEKQIVEGVTKIAKKNKKDDLNLRNFKAKPIPKVIEKKSVKNKYKEALELKRKQKVLNKKILRKEENDVDTTVGKKKNKKNNVSVTEKKKKNKENDSFVAEQNKTGSQNDESETDEEGEEEESENDENDENEEETNEELEAFKRKCQEMDEKKKNRLFIKLKKKIYSEAQIKELHPDIKSVIFPRKKKSRWCWAVFQSEERADEAMKALVKNKEVFVSKPNPYDQVTKKRKEKLKEVLKKKEKKEKWQKMWLSPS